MQIINNKALLLRTRVPAKIVEVIPQSAILKQVPGTDYFEVLVKWTHDNARVLKNIGFEKTPSPMAVKYNYPGMFKPFKHQRITSEFLSLHKRAFVLSEPGCVDADTEYLSPTGWKHIADYDGGQVAQYHPDSQTAEFVQPDAFVKQPCNDMIRFKTKYGVDQLLSPEHRMLLHSNAQYSKHVVMSAAHVKHVHDEYHAGVPYSGAGVNKKSGTDTVSLSHMAVPASFHITGGAGTGLSEPEMRVMIALIADGHFSAKGTTNHCIIRLKRPRKIERLRWLLTVAGIPFTEKLDQSTTGFGFHVFAFKAPYKIKHFDERWWDATYDELKIFVSEVLYWDGTQIHTKAFSSFDERSVDFVQYAFCATGHIARKTIHTRERRGKTETEYVVTVREVKGMPSLRNRKGKTCWPEPSPDGFKYCFTVPSTFLVFRRNGCVFCSGNTGKTSSCLWSADYLMTMGIIKRVLVVAPLSTLHSVWVDEICRTIIHRTVAVAHGTRKERKTVIEGNAEFVVINHDGIKLMVKELQDAAFDLIIYDEFTSLKHTTSERWKLTNAIVTPATWLWPLSGTPVPQRPTDAYGPVKLLNPSAVPKYFNGWRDQVMRQLNMYKWVPKPDAAARVHAAMQPAIRFEKKDCLDLPPVTFEVRDVEMTPMQEKWYKKMRDEMVIELKGTTITAVNAASRLTKLLQISCGSSYGSDDKVAQFDISTRLKVIREIIEQASGKVLIAVPYINALERLAEELAKEYTLEKIYGDVPLGRRREIFSAFQTQENPQLLILQPSAAAHGVNLTEADTIIWYSPTTSFEVYAQFNERINRPPQTKKMTVHLLQSCAAERQLNTALRTMGDQHLDLMKLYSEVLK